MMSKISIQYGPLKERAFIYALGIYYDMELKKDGVKEVASPPFCNIHMDPGFKTVNNMVDEYPYPKVREQLQSMHDKLVLERAPKYFLEVLFSENDSRKVSKLMLTWLNKVCATHIDPLMVFSHIKRVALEAVVKPKSVINNEMFYRMIPELQKIATLIIKR